MRKKLLKVVLVVALLYVALSGAIFAAMCQPPERFARIMARVPMAAFAVLPFRPLWYVARGGNLQVGALAPDFTLETADHSSRFQLSSMRGQKPVVLVFGSYT
ncbi:MAG TPA: hypothetical protein VGQ71_13455 [Terriglobales bacterium]|jgi:hypothetical protein|nr:hypothetical protein [Terriglobales bacterium]